MANPWEEISLDIYEKHMRLDSVRQLQTMNAMMKEQFAAYPVETAMILGVAGGNGLEHINTQKYRTVYGIDINRDYLRIASERFPALSAVLRCMRLDLVHDVEKIPQAQLVIANLLIEYIGYDAFRNVILQSLPAYVSAATQLNANATEWVSDSPYLHAFDSLDVVHHPIDENALIATMTEIEYPLIFRAAKPLPNGKILLRMDFQRLRNQTVAVD